jgi:hypothetical protein
MPGALVDALAVALVVVVMTARPRVVLGVLVFTTLIVPPTLVVPHTHSVYVTFAHVMALAGLARVIALRLQGGLRPGALRMTPMHYAFAVVIMISFVIGVAFVVAPTPVPAAGLRLATLFDQLAFFVVALALVRQIGDVRFALQVLAAGGLVTAAIAIGEHVTGHAYGHWLFSRLPDQQRTDAASLLQPRSGQLRVRAGTEFALELGWIALMLLPAVIATALRHRGWRLLVPAAALLVALASYWSYTRTAVAGLGVAVVVLLVLGRERRLTAIGASMLTAGVLAYIAHPAFAAHFGARADEGSITARFERLAPTFRQVALHPFRGFGLGGLSHSGFGTVDNAYLLEYVELGALGVTVLAVMFVVATMQTARALFVVQDGDRVLAAACLGGVLAYLASTMVYDAFTLLQGSRLFLFLVACATALAEQRAGPIRMRLPRMRPVLAVAAAGSAAGVVIYVFAPVHVAGDGLFVALPLTAELNTYDPAETGDVLVHTACGMIEATDLGVSVDCTAITQATGVGYLRLEAPSPDAVRSGFQLARTIVRDRLGETGYQFLRLAPPSAGRDAIWRTAPAWIPLASVELLLVMAWRRRASVRPAI